MENDIMDDLNDLEDDCDDYVCYHISIVVPRHILFVIIIINYLLYSLQVFPLVRSSSLRKELLGIPSAERIQSRIKTIKDVSGQFVDDVNIVLEKCGDSHYVIMVLSDLVSKLLNHFIFFSLSIYQNDLTFCQLIHCFLLQTINLAKILEGEKNKITVDIVKEHSKSEPDYKCVDSMHIINTILSRELPAERFGGIINIILAMRPSATTKEIEDSLV